MAARVRSREKPSRASARRTRERLLAAGRKAFASRGLGGASLREDILAKAGVSTGSFYHQFADKEDLLVEIVRGESARLLEDLRKSRAHGAIDWVGHGRAELLGEAFDRIERHPEFVKIYVREYHSDSARVRHAIRLHSERTIAQVRSYYEALSNSTAVPLDTEMISTLLSIQAIALVNYYLDFPKAKRALLRERLIQAMVRMGTGGILAVRAGEDEGPPR